MLTFQTSSGLRLGAKTKAGVLDLAAVAQSVGDLSTPVTPEGFFQAGLSALPAIAKLVQQAEGRSEFLQKEENLNIGPAVPNPGKILCIGLNYRNHALEAGMGIPTTPVLFSKFNNTIAAAGEGVPLPTNASHYDYEVELAVVIGKRARYVSQDQALQYVLGYCTANDMSTRDLQGRTSQFLLGKTQDKFLPIGPYLVTADQVNDPQSLTLKTWVNGDLRQNSSTADMIFSVAELVSYLSQYLPLEPGDLLLTGTPEGVILGMKEKVWLKPADSVTVEVEGLGRLTSPMVTE